MNGKLVLAGLLAIGAAAFLLLNDAPKVPDPFTPPDSKPDLPCPGPYCPPKPDVKPKPKPSPKPWGTPAAPVGADECVEGKHAVFLPSEIRRWYRNPDGSCVQCSIGMCGQDQNVPNAACLLWDTEYGSKERGGSWSGRVAEYAKKRGLKIYNITGENETFEWMKWACSTGRGCAIGAGSSHFQTLFGHDPKTGKWWVCNNNSTDKIDEYDDAAFRRLHMASGPWIVILDAPPHPANPVYREWWK